MAVDLKELNKEADDLGLEGEARKNWISIFQEEKVFGNYKKRGLRQDEFDRKLDTELKPKLKLAEDTKADLDAQLDALGKLRTETEGRVSMTTAEREKAEAKALKLEQSIRRVAADAGLDPDEYLKSVGIEPDDKGGKKADELPKGRYIDPETFGAGIRTSVNVAADLMKVNAEHRKLFGSDIENPQELVNYILEQGKKGRDISVTDAFNEKFNVSAKREEVRKADEDRRIKDAVDAALVKDRSDRAISGVTMTGETVQSPALALGRQDGKSRMPQHLLDAASRLATKRAEIAAGK